MKIDSENPGRSSREIIEYYTKVFSEADRLNSGPPLLELLRTQKILEERLTQPPAVILDIGGGPGVYTVWLLKKGYEVHLVDPVPLHIEQAQKAFKEMLDHPHASAVVGNALNLEFDDAVADVVLFFGPLYHLTTREERMQALSEALRVLRPGGKFFGVGISRFASLLDGLHRRFLEDPQFVEIVRGDLRDGRHRNPTDNPEYWTNAYFHPPEELEREVREAGFRFEELIGIEGPGWILEDLEDFWSRPERRDTFFELIKTIESEKSLIGASLHIMAIASKS